LEVRTLRTPPLRDEKLLLTSGALMAAALAKAGRGLEEPAYTREAERCIAFLLDNVRGGRGLVAVCGSAIPATLDGYAYLLWALLETHHSTLNSRWLDEARSLGGLMVETFSGENGLLYFTASDVDDLPIRGINAHDGATPSGQSVAAHCLLRLARLTGDAHWEEWFKSLAASLLDMLENNPEGHTWMMAALLHAGNGGMDVTLTPGTGLTALRAALRGFHPFMTVRLDAGDAPEQMSGAGYPDVKTASPLSDDYIAKAYVCKDNTCLAPVTAAAALAGIISQQDRDQVGSPRQP
jgi:hypothetical protein